jgi:adenosylhomocysteine nucleosidase
MPQEIEALLHAARASDWKCERIGDREFHRANLCGQDVVLVFSRWGKVAAAITATHLIDAFGIDSLWFTGVAGALDPSLNIGDIVVADGLIQHDLDARPLFPRFEIPLSGRTRLQTDSFQRAILHDAAAAFLEREFKEAIPADVRTRFAAAPRVVQADIATGDRFIASAEDVANLRASLPTCACVEMEGAAVAQACTESGIPFAVLRVISDSADGNAHMDFPRFVAEFASVYSHKIVMNALASIAARGKR